MTDEDRLTELLIAWEARSGATEVDPALFCVQRGAPDLTEPFRRLLQDLGKVGLAKSGTEPDFSTAPARVDFVAGRYRAESLLGQGGLGVVFRAVDAELDRPVALKRLHAGDLEMDRFIFEARLTGRLEHPGIVPVYGLVSDRRTDVCYAMRLISGVTLNDAIASFHEKYRRTGTATLERIAYQSSELRRLLQSLVTVCDTLAYAHSKKVVHRDLKPQNIMLGEFGECLVIDWGMARVLGDADKEPDPHLNALREQLASDQEQTFAGQAKGTWAYMAPEQARGEWNQVGPAADIFALGATLFKLLTGKSPYQDNFDREAVKAGRFAPPRQIAPNVPSPLQAVVLKAMSPDAANRYDDARSMARDIEGWLADEPVSVFRDPWTTRMRRWAKRHRTVIASAAAIVVVGIAALAAGLVIVTAKNRTIVRERDKTKKAADEATAINAFYRMHVLAAPRPRGRGPGRDIRLAEALDHAEPKIATSFENQPLIEADVRQTLGQTYYELGRNRAAADQLKRAFELRRDHLGMDHANTLVSLIAWATAVREGENPAEAIGLYRLGLPHVEKLQGSEGHDTIALRGNLGTALRHMGQYAEAERELRPQMEIALRVLGEDHETTQSAMNDLALVLHELGQQEEAEKLFRRCHATAVRLAGPDAPESLSIEHNIGLILQATDRMVEAETLFRPLVEARKRVQGPEHADTFKSIMHHAQSLIAVGKVPEAERNIAAALDDAKKSLGVNHAVTLTLSNDYAMVMMYLGNAEKAEPILRDTLARRQSVLPKNHADTLETQSNVAYCLVHLNRIDEAIELFRLTSETARKALPAGHRLRQTADTNYAATLVRAKRYAEAEPVLRNVIEMQKAALGPDHDSTLTSISFLGQALGRQGKLTAAIPWYREAYEARVRTKGQNAPATIEVAAALGEALHTVDIAKKAVEIYRHVWNAHSKLPPRDMKRLRTQSYFASMLADAGLSDEAEPLARDNHAYAVESRPAGDPQVSGAQSLLGGILLDQGKFDEAATFLRASLASREKTHPKGHWQSGTARVRLGACEGGLKNFEAGEELLLQGRQTLQDAADAPVNRRQEAVRRLVAFYIRWQKPAEAKRWRMQLDKSD